MSQKYDKKSMYAKILCFFAHCRSFAVAYAEKRLCVTFFLTINDDCLLIFDNLILQSSL